MITFSLGFLYSQTDTIQEVEEVRVFDYVSRLEIKSWKNIYFNQEEIELIEPVDLGDLLNKTVGANVKSYGGVGGLKTISYRGMGANHTSIIVDGFSVNNDQTGQVNLGNIQVDNIVEVAAQGFNRSVSIPVKAHLQGGSYSISTFENAFSNKRIQVRKSVKIGSFGTEKQYFSVKYSNNGVFLSFYENYTQSDGSYPYRLKNGDEWTNNKRKNNDYLQIESGLNLGVKIKKVMFRASASINTSTQGLPGAVIFYNNTEDSRLSALSKKLNVDFRYANKKSLFRLYSSLSSRNLLYFDPTYLNNDGFLKNRYVTNYFTLGLKATSNVNKQFKFIYGVEWNNSALQAEGNSILERPNRDYIAALFALAFSPGKLNVILTPSIQYVVDENRVNMKKTEKTVFTPLAKIAYNIIEEKLILEANFKRTFRMPTFNDMYYSGIGNTDLLPEKAIQFDLAAKVLIKKKNFSTTWILNGFYNSIEDKIIAIPTQNLFVWSMQNLGEVHVVGGELLWRTETKLLKSVRFNTTTGYTYQLTRDKSNSESILYNAQIPYMPQHVLNVDFSFSMYDFTLNLSNQYVSSRYSLYENIPKNLIEGFFISDVVLKYSKRLSTHKITVLAGVKNIFNQSYEVVRNYVMPQRNYFITLKYAFN